MAKPGFQLTSVNVKMLLFSEFKISGSVLNNFSFTDLVNNALDQFLTDGNYRTKTLNYTPVFTGSSQVPVI